MSAPAAISFMRNSSLMRLSRLPSPHVFERSTPSRPSRQGQSDRWKSRSARMRPTSPPSYASMASGYPVGIAMTERDDGLTAKSTAWGSIRETGIGASRTNTMPAPVSASRTSRTPQRRYARPSHVGISSSLTSSSSEYRSVRSNGVNARTFRCGAAKARPSPQPSRPAKRFHAKLNTFDPHSRSPGRAGSGFAGGCSTTGPLAPGQTRTVAALPPEATVIASSRSPAALQPDSASETSIASCCEAPPSGLAETRVSGVRRRSTPPAAKETVFSTPPRISNDAENFPLPTRTSRASQRANAAPRERHPSDAAAELQESAARPASMTR